MILSRFLRRNETAERRLYGAIVAAARRPVPYARWGVPDTVSGRFDMIALHLFLVLDRLKGEAPEFRQKLVDEFFADMDRSLREMGVGDLSVGKKVRKMAESFYGRVAAYEKALAEGGAVLNAALVRNVFPDGEPDGGGARLAAYVLAARNVLQDQPSAAIAGGSVSFPEPTS
jgi:cytochrome b pre-mRNA-processing protein 3